MIVKTRGSAELPGFFVSEYLIDILPPPSLTAMVGNSR